MGFGKRITSGSLADCITLNVLMCNTVDIPRVNKLPEYCVSSSRQHGTNILNISR